MKVSDLIKLAESRLAALNNARATAEALGQDSRLADIDADILETEATLAQLRSLV